MAKLSEKDTANMEVVINELKEKLSQEQEKCKKLQDDLSSHTERESKISQSITTVSILILELIIKFLIAIYVNNLLTQYIIIFF